MSFKRLEFSKDWTRHEDFPTVQTDESQIREDLQVLHNETRDALNHLAGELEATEASEKIGIRMPEVTGGANPGTVQQAVDALGRAIELGGAVPAGGKTGQVLAKASDEDNKLQWQDAIPEYLKQENVLSQGTRLALGLDTDSSVDDAFRKLSTAEKTFQDVETGKLYKVRSKIQSWGTRDVDYYSNKEDGSLCSVIRAGDKLFITSGLHVDSNTRYHCMQAFDVTNNTLLTNNRILDVNYAGLSIDRSRHISLDDHIYRFTGEAGIRYLYDFNRNVLLQLGQYYANDSFATENYWGWTYIDGSSTRQFRYAKKGSTTTSTLSLGSLNTQSDYDALVVGITGDTVYFLSKTANQKFRLDKADLSSGSKTTGLLALTLGSSTSKYGYLERLFTTGDHAYFVVTYDGSNFTTILDLNLKDITSNIDEVKAGSKLINDETYNATDLMTRALSSLSNGYYIGTVGSCAYFLIPMSYATCVVEFNKDVSTLLVYEAQPAIPNASTYVSSVVSCGLNEVVFAMSDAPGVIVNNNYTFDTNTGRISVFAGETFVNLPSSGNGIYDSYLLPKGCTHLVGTIRTSDALGLWYDYNGFFPNKLIGGVITRTVDSIEEVTE